MKPAITSAFATALAAASFAAPVTARAADRHCGGIDIQACGGAGRISVGGHRQPAGSTTTRPAPRLRYLDCGARTAEVLSSLGLSSAIGSCAGLSGGCATATALDSRPRTPQLVVSESGGKWTFVSASCIVAANE